MVIEFFASPASPHCRSVHMLLNVLKLDYNYKQTHPLNGETQTKEYLAVKSYIGFSPSGSSS